MWETLQHILQEQGSGGDLVVRLSAAVAIREAVDVGSLSVILNYYS